MPPQSAAGRRRNRLAAAMAVSVTILAVELFAGIAGNSLALMADAGHVFADVSGMAVSLGAIWLANRPASGERSFGLFRLEILAAAANALLLLAVSLFVIWKACDASRHHLRSIQGWSWSSRPWPSARTSCRSQC